LTYSDFEPLCGGLQGWWSRPITLEDRLISRVTGEDAGQRLEIAQRRFRY
jgi:toxin YoeB